MSWLQRRYDRSVPADLRDYPWWLAVGTTVGSCAIAVAAVAQRGSAAGSWPVVTGGLLALVPNVTKLYSLMLPRLLSSALMIAAVALLLSHPVSGDLAPVLLMMLASEVTATSRPLIGLIDAIASIAMLVAVAAFASLPGVWIYVVGVVLGFEVGYTLLWQKRALGAERDRHLVERRQAASAERQRIAREIHDVVAHSLSVTLLHVTGARRALQADRDVDEAVDALTEAERVGRQAMADIRRTVGLLSEGRTGSAPLPGGGRDRRAGRVRASGRRQSRLPAARRSRGCLVGHESRRLPDHPGVTGQHRQARAASASRCPPRPHRRRRPAGGAQRAARRCRRHAAAAGRGPARDGRASRSARRHLQLRTRQQLRTRRRRVGRPAAHPRRQRRQPCGAWAASRAMHREGGGR
jgi:hypothetical protein